MKVQSAEELIETMKLIRHPEGGWFRETYRSAETIPADGLPARYCGDRAFSTAIYFLLEKGYISALHRIKSDEIWHFYSGTSLRICVISPDGEARSFVLGNDLSKGEVYQAIVPAGCWFGAYVIGDGPYALVGCTVAPGFDFGDFQLGSRGELIARWPEHAALIRRLTRV